MAASFDLAPTTTALSHWFYQLYQSVSQWVGHWVSTATGYGVEIGHRLANFPAQVGPAVTSPAAWHPLLYAVLLLVMLVGVVGSVVPVLPGMTLILGAIIVWGLAVGFAGLKWALGVAIVALILSLLIDYLAGVLGAQRVGASKWGQIGAFVGMFLGLFGLLPFLPTGIPLLGILLGTVLGAFIGEFLHRRELKFGQRIVQASKVGVAIVVGTLVGTVLELLLAIISVVVFLVTTWPGNWG